MSKTLLVEHLLIEFMNDPDLDRHLVHDDVSDIFEIWHKNAGRHYPAEQVSTAFDLWWQKVFEDHRLRHGKPISYRQLIDHLAESA